MADTPRVIATPNNTADDILDVSRYIYEQEPQPEEPERNQAMRDIYAAYVNEQNAKKKKGHVYRLFAKVDEDRSQKIDEKEIAELAAVLFKEEGRQAFIDKFTAADADAASGVTDGLIDRSEFYSAITGEKVVNKNALKINRGNKLRTEFATLKEVIAESNKKVNEEFAKLKAVITESNKKIEEAGKTMWDILDDTEFRGELDDRVTIREMNILASELFPVKGLAADEQKALIAEKSAFLKGCTAGDEAEGGNNDNVYDLAEFVAGMQIAYGN